MSTFDKFPVPPIDFFDFQKVKKVNIETRDECNRKCSFCPRATYEDTCNDMPIELYTEIMNQLAELDYKGPVSPLLLNEALCDDRIVDIVGITHKILPESIIFIDTNGDFLTRKLLLELVGNGLRRLVVNHYDDRNEHLFLVTEGIPSLLVTHRYTEEIELYNRAGACPVDSETNRDFCVKIFQRIPINYKGDVVLCCADFFGDVVMGNVGDMHISEIWRSSNFEKYREAHSAGMARTMPLCSKCNRLRMDNDEKPDTTT